LQTVGCLLSLYLMSPQMTLLTAAIVPAVVAVGALFGALLRRLSFRAQQQSGLAAGVAAEAFQNIRTVKVMAMEEAEIRFIDNILYKINFY
jgi:ATP-binding cassette, subfamily B (MDR/TAP), member 8